MINNNDLKTFLTFAEKLAHDCGQLMLQARDKVEIKIQKQEKHDFATNIDLYAEKLIKRAINASFPDHGIFSEESPETTASSSFRWVIDPLDGTWSYKAGLPLFGTIIGLEYHGEMVLGVFHLPQTKETFTVIKGQGVFLNNLKVNCSSQANLKHAFIYCRHPSYQFPESELDRVIRLQKNLTQNCYRVYPTHTSSIDLVRVAQGAFDGKIWLHGGSKWWDIGLGMLMVREAGGKVTTFSGEEATEKNYAQGFIASNGKLHQQLLKIVNEY